MLQVWCDCATLDTVLLPRAYNQTPVKEELCRLDRTVGRCKCEYMHAVDKLKGFGAANKESLADLVWAFFEHWAWKHDFNNAVVSVRTGTYLAKASKEWTRRVGADRHLICIEVRRRSIASEPRFPPAFKLASKPAPLSASVWPPHGAPLSNA